MTAGVRCSALCLALGGCMAGGGPYVEYGQHGWNVGAEAGTGLWFASGNVGVSTQGPWYLRGDLFYSPGLSLDPRNAVPTTERLGVGTTLDGGPDPLVGAAGGGVDHVLRQLAHCKSGPISADPNVVAGIELSVRYLRGWSIALVPRIDTYVVPCTRT